jgi:hypothetical protein
VLGFCGAYLWQSVAMHCFLALCEGRTCSLTVHACQRFNMETRLLVPLWFLLLPEQQALLAFPVRAARLLWAWVLKRNLCTWMLHCVPCSPACAVFCGCAQVRTHALAMCLLLEGSQVVHMVCCNLVWPFRHTNLSLAFVVLSTLLVPHVPWRAAALCASLCSRWT